MRWHRAEGDTSVVLHIAVTLSCPRVCVSAMSRPAVLLAGSVDAGDQIFEVLRAEPASPGDLACPIPHKIPLSVGRGVHGPKAARQEWGCIPG